MSPDWRSTLAENVARVSDEVAAACDAAGRPAESVRLVAVTKYVEPEVIRALLDLGVREIAENRVQQHVRRVAELSEHPPATGNRPHWHFVGHLQRNKVSQLLRSGVALLHAIDSPRLATELSEQAARLDMQVDGLIEVNVSGEASKYGCAPDDVEALATQFVAAPNLRLSGLMTMAPLDDDPAAARPHFARLRTILEKLRDQGVVPESCRELSMGMSGDFPAAIAEGATLVRIGSSLFDGLPDELRTPRR